MPNIVAKFVWLARHSPETALATLWRNRLGKVKFHRELSLKFASIMVTEPEFQQMSGKFCGIDVMEIVVGNWNMSLAKDPSEFRRDK